MIVFLLLIVLLILILLLLILMKVLLILNIAQLCYVFKFWMLTTTFQKSHALSFICMEFCTILIITKLINKKYRRVQAAPITIGARKKGQPYEGDLSNIIIWVRYHTLALAF